MCYCNQHTDGFIYLNAPHRTETRYLSLTLPFSPSRQKTGFNQIKISGSLRSAFFLEADGNEAEVAVSQPADCLFLQRKDVKCIRVINLSLFHPPRSTPIFQHWRAEREDTGNTIRYFPPGPPHIHRA